MLRDWFSLFVKFPFPVSTAIVLGCYYGLGTLLVDKKTSVSLQLINGLRLLYAADDCFATVCIYYVEHFKVMFVIENDRCERYVSCFDSFANIASR